MFSAEHCCWEMTVGLAQLTAYCGMMAMVTMMFDDDDEDDDYDDDDDGNSDHKWQRKTCKKPVMI